MLVNLKGKGVKILCTRTKFPFKLFSLNHRSLPAQVNKS